MKDIRFLPCETLYTFNRIRGRGHLRQREQHTGRSKEVYLGDAEGGAHYIYVCVCIYTHTHAHTHIHMVFFSYFKP